MGKDLKTSSPLGIEIRLHVGLPSHEDKRGGSRDSGKGTRRLYPRRLPLCAAWERKTAAISPAQAWKQFSTARVPFLSPPSRQPRKHQRKWHSQPPKTLLPRAAASCTPPTWMPRGDAHVHGPPLVRSLADFYAAFDAAGHPLPFPHSPAQHSSWQDEHSNLSLDLHD